MEKARFHVEGFLIGPKGERFEMSGYIKAHTRRQAYFLTKKNLAETKNLPIECFDWAPGTIIDQIPPTGTLPLFPE